MRVTVRGRVAYAERTNGACTMYVPRDERVDRDRSALEARCAVVPRCVFCSAEGVLNLMGAHVHGVVKIKNVL